MALEPFPPSPPPHFPQSYILYSKTCITPAEATPRADRLTDIHKQICADTTHNYKANLYKP